MEKIIEIKDYVEKGRNSVEGFEVVTSKQSIKLFIDNESQCCENFGYFWCNDDPQDFIGAQLHSVKLTDTALNEALLKANELDPNDECFEGNVMFVNLETDRGTLQFVVYNEHNGYYGHEATVHCSQLSHTECL